MTLRVAALWFLGGLMLAVSIFGGIALVRFVDDYAADMATTH